MKWKKVTPETLPAVMARLLVYILQDTPDNMELTKANCDWLNKVLDDLTDEDAFGTEGQCDPRGDQRTRCKTA